MNFTLRSLRSAVVVLSLAMVPGIAVMAAQSEGDGSGSTSQECDEQAVAYAAPGGSVNGTGTSPERADKDAAKKASATVRLSLSPCELCPNGDECLYSVSYDWTGYTGTPPVYDPATGLYKCTHTWTGCTVTQKCYPCS